MDNSVFNYYLLSIIYYLFKKTFYKVFFSLIIISVNIASPMLVKTYGSAVYGVDAVTITIEVNWMEQSTKDPMIVGLPDSAVKESMQRVESTIKSNGLIMPRTKVVINLAPADIRKSGTAFDLPIAMGLLAATEQVVNRELLE